MALVFLQSLLLCDCCEFVMIVAFVCVDFGCQQSVKGQWTFSVSTVFYMYAVSLFDSAKLTLHFSEHLLNYCKSSQVKSSQSLIRMSIAHVYKSKNRHKAIALSH